MLGWVGETLSHSLREPEEEGLVDGLPAVVERRIAAAVAVGGVTAAVDEVRLGEPHLHRTVEGPDELPAPRPVARAVVDRVACNCKVSGEYSVAGNNLTSAV